MPRIKNFYKEKLRKYQKQITELKAENEKIIHKEDLKWIHEFMEFYNFNVVTLKTEADAIHKLIEIHKSWNEKFRNNKDKTNPSKVSSLGKRCGNERQRRQVRMTDKIYVKLAGVTTEDWIKWSELWKIKTN
jgi:hypothetical protein